MKNWLKSSFVGAARNPLVKALFCNFNKKNVIFLGYHGISRDSDEYEAWTLVREKNFYAQMDFLKSNFECLSIDEALQCSNNRAKAAAVVTFDDGYANNLYIALPILEEFGIPAVIYVATGPVLRRELFWPDVIWLSAKRAQLAYIDLSDISACLGIYHLGGNKEIWQQEVMRLLEDIKKIDTSDRRNIVGLITEKFRRDPSAAVFNIEAENNVFTPLTEDQIRILSCHPLITLGAHTHDHELLDRVTLSAAEQSVRKSKIVLERITGKQIEHFAYPNGNFSPDLMYMVKQIGFKSALSFSAGYYHHHDNRYAIRRVGIGSDVNIDLFSAMTVGIFDLKWRLNS